MVWGYESLFLNPDLLKLPFTFPFYFGRCSICNGKFKTQIYLDQHQNVHKVERTEICEICGAGFKSRDALLTHGRVHRENRKLYPCQVEGCDKVFKTNAGLREHKIKHSGRRDYKCQICGQDFMYPEVLKHHLILHTDLMPFSCEICNRKFRHKVTLKNHMRTHGNGRE
jgi:KRAB domain-containing zinc finger protein